MVAIAAAACAAACRAAAGAQRLARVNSSAALPSSEVKVLQELYQQTHAQECHQGWDGGGGDPCSWHKDNDVPIVRCENGHVTTFSLNGCGWVGPIPDSIDDLTELTWLTFANPKATTLGTGTIPASVGNLAKLETLQITDTSVSGTLPQTIGGLTSLKLFEIEYNKLSGTIPNGIGQLTRLTRFSCNANGATSDFENVGLSGTLPASMAALTALQTLSLALNDFSGTLPAMDYASISSYCNVGYCASHNPPYCNVWECPLPEDAVKWCKANCYTPAPLPTHPTPVPTYAGTCIDSSCPETCGSKCGGCWCKTAAECARDGNCCADADKVCGGA